jgi:hypothetical protein
MRKTGSGEATESVVGSKGLLLPERASVLWSFNWTRPSSMSHNPTGNPPEGHTRWTVRLVAEEAVKRKLMAGGGRRCRYPD